MMLQEIQAYDGFGDVRNNEQPRKGAAEADVQRQTAAAIRGYRCFVCGKESVGSRVWAVSGTGWDDTYLSTSVDEKMLSGVRV